MKRIRTTLLACATSLFTTSNVMALQGGADDADTTRNNATVKVGSCTGTLITPTLVLSSGHCFERRPRPAGHSDFPHTPACRDWQRPDRWYTLGAPVPVRVGGDSQNWRFQTQANSYSLPGCIDIILLRLDAAVPAAVARPARVATDPQRSGDDQQPLQVVGWGSSGLEDLWARDAVPRDRPWSVIGHAHKIEGMAQDGGHLYAATEAGSLWQRLADEANRPWRYVGRAANVVAMAASGGNLYAATTTNRLIRRPASGTNQPWTDIDGAYRIVGMTALAGRLYAATESNRLYSRQASSGSDAWSNIGHANGIVGLAAAGGRLYGATRGNRLWVREPGDGDLPWRRAGSANDVRAMAATQNRLYVAQRDVSAGAPQNSRRYRQQAAATVDASSCGSGSALSQRAQFCVDPAGNARIRSGDSGGPVYATRSAAGPKWLIGVARQDAGTRGVYVRTAFVNTDDGRLGTGDIGPWLQRMAGQ